MLEFLKTHKNKVIIAFVAIFALAIVIAIVVEAYEDRDLSSDQAKDIALANAKVSENDIVSLNIEKLNQDDETIYRISFETDETAYTYDIEKDDGDIVNSAYYSKNGNTQNNSTTDSQNTDTAIISEDEAKKIALDDAGILEENATIYKLKKEYDDGIAIYDIEFISDNTEYDYNIAQSDGTILSKDFDIENYSINTDEDLISQDEAVAIVLERVAGAKSDDVRIELDRDDGRTLYEGEVYYDGREYEFEIDASSGNVIEWSSERWD